MSLKEFYDWANQRACDGRWDLATCMSSISIIEEIKQVPFWKRDKIWKTKYEFTAMALLKNNKKYYEKMVYKDFESCMIECNKRNNTVHIGDMIISSSDGCLYEVHDIINYNEVYGLYAGESFRITNYTKVAYTKYDEPRYGILKLREDSSEMELCLIAGVAKKTIAERNGEHRIEKFYKLDRDNDNYMYSETECHIIDVPGDVSIHKKI